VFTGSLSLFPLSGSPIVLLPAFRLPFRKMLHCLPENSIDQSTVHSKTLNKTFSVYVCILNEYDFLILMSIINLKLLRMKKIYFLASIVISLFLLLSSKSFAQDMIVGGNMENADNWTTCALNTGADNSVTYEFNYTGDKPTAGVGGCLYIAGTNTGTGDGQGTNFMFYQQVTLQYGVPYTFDLAYKDVRTNNFWFETYIGPNEPTVGSDYGAAQGATFMGGWKSSNWESINCPGDQWDGTLLLDGCAPNDTNPKTYEGTGEITVYIGFRMGIWDGEANGYSFEVYVDNVSLTGPGSSVRNYTDPNKVNVFPNPASGKVTVANIESDKIRIVNLAGQEVLRCNVTHKVMNLDVSGLSKGLYLLKSGDSTAKLMIE
jgi:hypothetical protein